MKLKRLLVFLLAFVMLLSVVPAVYASDIVDQESTTEPTVDASDQTEQTEPSVTEESTEPPADEYDGELDPVLVEAGFTSDQLQAGNVLLEPISTFAASTRSVKKTATLRNCNWMDFPCTDNSRQGFHYADEDGAAPWDYMNMIYCLENKKDFSYGSGHSGVGELPLDGSGDTHGESIWYGFSADQRVAIALTMLYGAPTKLWDESWGINATDDWNLHNPNIGYRFATQAIIWEFVQGLREPTPPYKLNSTYWLDKSQGVCMSEDGKTDHFMVAYNSIISDLQLHNTIPSFAGDFAATAPEIQLAGTSTTVTDTNGVLGRFTFTGSGGVSYSKNGNNLTITANGAIPTGVQSASATLPDAASSLYEVWYNQYDKSKQVCIKVAIPASDPVPAYFKLKASNGSLSLKKTTEDGKNLAGWQFSIYSDQNCTNRISGPHTTDANGNISVANLTAGQVWVKEIGHTNAEIAKLYYCNSTNPQAVTIVAGQTASVTFNNKLSTGVAKIVKTATNGGSVSGWHFTVKNSAGAVVGNYVTDSSGVISLNLLPGTYSVTETDGAYKYWVNDPNPTKTVTVTAGQTAKVTFQNQYRGQAQIIKTATTGGSVEGWHFTVKDSAGNKVGDYVTDSTGIITLDLEPGTYTVTETDGKYTYWHNDPNPEKKVTVVAGQTAKVTFLNEWIGKAKIIKTATNNGSVEGWHFSIFTADGTKIGDYVTDSTGIITVDLEPGVYTVKETDGEYPYWHNDPEPEKTVTVVAGETVEVTFLNEWVGKAKIIKTLANPEAGTVEGWQFTISRIVGETDAVYLATVTTGADGTIEYDLEPGQYLITELIEENSLWECITDQSVVITVTAGQTTEVPFTNALRPGKISIHKVDTRGESLDSTEFTLEWSEDGVNWQPVSYTDSTVPQIGGCTTAGLLEGGKLVTDETGLVSFEGLYPTLQYRLTETKAKNGYQLLQSSAYEGGLDVENELVVSLKVVNAEVFTMPETGGNTLIVQPWIVLALLC
ncbi:MAG: Cys-Gln thioester bond-forming surface protein, partial [Oscillospiraceae bacterium]|nr:Cys-Gln thioester bond-forming surface protein [Oscillospiraceae bacterium]